MQKILSTLFFLLTFLFANSALAGGAPASKSSFDWEKSSIKDVASDFVMKVGQDQFQQNMNLDRQIPATPFRFKFSGYEGCTI